MVGIRTGEPTIIETKAGSFGATKVINCAGLYADKIALMARADAAVRIVPFRGEYYELAENRRGLVRNLIYPVPNAALPFLWRPLHASGERVCGSGRKRGPRSWPRGIQNGRRQFWGTGVGRGFPGSWKMAKRFWKVGTDEYHRSLSKTARSLQKLMPEIREEDLSPGGSGVRGQANESSDKLVDDFHIVQSNGIVHVLNVASPAATPSIALTASIVDANPL